MAFPERLSHRLETQLGTHGLHVLLAFSDLYAIAYRCGATGCGIIVRWKRGGATVVGMMWSARKLVRDLLVVEGSCWASGGHNADLRVGYIRQVCGSVHMRLESILMFPVTFIVQVSASIEELGEAKTHLMTSLEGSEGTRVRDGHHVHRRV